MKPHLTCASAAMVLSVALISSAEAAFTALGTSGWEYEAPTGLTIGTVSTVGGDNTTFTLTHAAWPGLNPLSVIFQTKSGVTQYEQFFWMNMDVKGTVAWSGFKFEFSDAYDAIEGNAFHPIWAHIHPGNSSSDYKEFSTLNPSTGAGRAELVATGGPLAAGTAWKPTMIRLHDMSSTAYTTGDPGAMRFTMTLTPIPDSGTTGSLLLCAGGVLVAATRIRKRS